jgi:hypothetical protein
MTNGAEATPVGRRAFLGMAAGASAVLYALPVSAATARLIEPPFRPQAASALHKPVGTVFMDMPYVDMTGLAEPYLPPKTVSFGRPQAHFAWDYQWAFHTNG